MSALLAALEDEAVTNDAVMELAETLVVGAIAEGAAEEPLTPEQETEVDMAATLIVAAHLVGQGMSFDTVETMLERDHVLHLSREVDDAGVEHLGIVFDFEDGTTVGTA